MIKERIIAATQLAVKGWGINVETIEISEVRISSPKFFGYLQTSFRDEENLKAERIRQETENEIKAEELIRSKKYDIENSKAEAETRRLKLKLKYEEE